MERADALSQKLLASHDVPYQDAIHRRRIQLMIPVAPVQRARRADGRTACDALTPGVLSSTHDCFTLEHARPRLLLQPDDAPSGKDPYMPRPSYPKRIYLDDFLDDFQQHGGWIPKVIRLASRAVIEAAIPGQGRVLGGRYGPSIAAHEGTRQAIAEQMQRVRDTRVTVVTPELMSLVLEAANGIIRRCVRRNTLTRFALDPLPRTPQWIEFSPPYLGDSGFAIHALWFDTAQHHYGTDQFAHEIEVDVDGNTWPIPHNTVVMTLLESPWDMKTMHLYPDGSHSIVQNGKCRNSLCALAQTTRQGVAYALHSERDHARVDAAQQQSKHLCACFFDAWCWSVILYALFAYLRLEQAQGPEAVEKVPYHVEVPHMKRQAREREDIEREVDDWNRVRPAHYRVVHVVKPAERLARIARRHNTLTGDAVADVETAPTGAPSAGRYADTSRYEAVEHMLEPFPRFLVAGPGLPWTTTRVVMVYPKKPRRYYRRRDSAGSVRIIAQP